MKPTEDPLERAMSALLDRASIRYTRPERDKADPTTLDFHLTDIGLYIEVKQFHTDRIAGQLGAMPHTASALVLVGPDSIKAFARLVAALSK